MCIIIEVITLQFSGKGNKANMQTIGWGVLPIFTPNQYVKSGVYQIPIIKGAVNKDFVKMLRETDPMELIIEHLENKKSKFKMSYLRPMSIIVRLIDSQREVIK